MIQGIVRSDPFAMAVVSHLRSYIISETILVSVHLAHDYVSGYVVFIAPEESMDNNSSQVLIGVWKLLICALPCQSSKDGKQSDPPCIIHADGIFIELKFHC